MRLEIWAAWCSFPMHGQQKELRASSAVHLEMREGGRWMLSTMDRRGL